MCVEVFTPECNQNSQLQGCVEVKLTAGFIHNYTFCNKRDDISRKGGMYIERRRVRR